jgi:hypothetical protein
MNWSGLEGRISSLLEVTIHAILRKILVRRAVSSFTDCVSILDEMLLSLVMQRKSHLCMYLYGYNLSCMEPFKNEIRTLLGMSPLTFRNILASLLVQYDYKHKILPNTSPCSVAVILACLGYQLGRHITAERFSD